MIWLLPHPPPHVSKLSLFFRLPVCRRSKLLTGEGGRGWAVAKSYDGEKALSSLNHSILSAPHTYVVRTYLIGYLHLNNLYIKCQLVILYSSSSSVVWVFSFRECSSLQTLCTIHTYSSVHTGLVKINCTILKSF
jgi:hypothetical protein